MNKLLYSVCLVGLLLGGTLSHRDAQAQDTLYARHIIRDLSSPAFHGRGASYKGDSVAADYLRAEFRRIGVAPLCENFFQHYTYSTFSMEGACWMEVNGRKLRNFEEFRVAPWSQTIDCPNQPVVSLPWETFIDLSRLRKFIEKHQQTLAQSFVYINASSLRRSDKATQDKGRKLLAALKRENPFGSRGIIVGLSELNTMSLGGCEQEHGYVYIEVLAKSMPRRTDHIGICVHTQFHPNYRTQNVCGVVYGDVDTMVVVTAHYDHLGTMGDGYRYLPSAAGEPQTAGEVIFGGAHDNASGVAAVMDLARMAVQERPHYTMVFMLFSGEEAGLKGSTYAAQHPLVDFKKVRLLLNIDMFCGGEEGLMVFNAKSESTKPYYERLKTLNDALQIAPEVRPRDNSANSDHWPFRDLCPAMFVLTMGMPYGGYHDPADTCGKCGLQYYNNYLLLISSLTM
ncbi:MAG: M28 family peptidase [Bacteroidales bacterium]|nr:M28 family peptidase [Bacteroidales bacterium]